MQLETYNNKVYNITQLKNIEENLIDLLQYYILFANIDKLSFFQYDYELNQYDYKYTLSDSQIFTDTKYDLEDFQYTLIVENVKNTFGIIAFNEEPKKTEIVEKLFVKIEQSLEKLFTLRRQLIIGETAKSEIYLINDESSKEFTKKLKTSLQAIINTDIKIANSIVEIEGNLKTKTKKSVLIYIVEDASLIKSDEFKLKETNEFLLVIGPDNFDLSLYCGQLQVYKYLSKDKFIPEQVKSILNQIKTEVQNKYIHENKIITLAGISGGVGTTTVAMNLANLLAKKNSDKNILYIDMSLTKAISNLFLEQNPLPKKTIIDLVNSASYDIDKNLENGLVKVRENFYAINGIQKHIDSDYLEQEIFLEKFLEYISRMGEVFNYIIIDTGEATASSLKSTLYDISNDLWILTEMTLPQISKLKTFFSLMKRAGLKDKLTFLVNRYDSDYAISVSDVISILNTGNDENLNFDFKIPNDYKNLGYCWNYCELVTDSYPDSQFVEVLDQVLLSKNLVKKDETKEKDGSLFSFFKRDK